MSSIFKKPRPSQPRGRNGFDMSFHRSFTAPCGMLLPVAKDFANPGDKYKLNSSLFIRTEALQSAAFQKFKVHVDWFFTPIDQIFSLWNEFFNSTNDVNSSIFQIGNIQPSLPLFSVYDFRRNTSKWFDSTKKTYTFDYFGTPLAFNFRRLWDMLDYGSVLAHNSAGSVGTSTDLQLPLLDFLTYHRIYYSHYNPTDWFAQDNTLFNVDQFYDSTPTEAVTKKVLSTIHYRPWRKDYFTTVMPTPLFGSNFANSLTGVLINGNMRYNITPEGIVNSLGPDRFVVNAENTISDGNASTIIPDPSAAIDYLRDFNVADLRSAFALDKLLRTTAFAGSHYDEQTLAHFGYKMPQGISKEVYFLGSQTTDVTIGEVVATGSSGATEDGEPLAGSTIGDIAGKGFGATGNQGDLSFECPCHGYIMAIFSIEPLQTYASMGIKRVNRYKGPYDFYHSEFDNVGMQPAFVGDLDGTFDNTNVFGWQYRWQELKTNYDVVNESFWATSRSTWVAVKLDSVSLAEQQKNIYSDKNYRFLINPTFTNPIFLMSFNSFGSEKVPLPTASQTAWTDAPWSAQRCYGADPFLVDADFKIFKSSIMSVHSLPSF